MRVTIITVVKNDKINIGRTIDSVLNQNYKNIEYIIIDGNSNDGTYEVIKKSVKKIKKKKFRIIRQKDRSMYEALNNAIKISNGQIIGLLHSGDIYFNKNIVSFIIKYFKNEINAVSGNALFLSKRGNIKRVWNYKIGVLNKYSCFKIAHTTLFLEKKLINKIGKYNINYKICSDTDFLLRLSNYEKLKFKYIDAYFVKMLEGGLSNSYKTLFKKFAEDIKIYFKYFKYLFIFIYFYKILYKFVKLLSWKLFK